MAIALIAVVIFIAGAVAGGYLLIILGIRQEERRQTMLHRLPPDASSRAARPITGLWARRQIDTEESDRHREDLYV